MATPTNSSANGASISFRQPERRHAPVADSSYLRLGAYAADDTTGRSERQLIPDLSTMTSAVSSNDGVLLYTNKDLQETVLGSAWMKYGHGHTVEVAQGDATYHVATGRYDLSARNGIVIKAGETDGDGNIVASADIVITAKGDLLQTSNQDFVKKTEGQKYEFSVLSTVHLNVKEHITSHFAANNTVSIFNNSINIGSAQHIVGGLSIHLCGGKSYSYRKGPSVYLGLGSHHNVVKGDLEIDTFKRKIEKIFGSRKICSKGSVMLLVGKNFDLKSDIYKESSAASITRTGKYVFDTAAKRYRSNPKLRYASSSHTFNESSQFKYGNYGNFSQSTSNSYTDTFNKRISKGDFMDIAAATMIDVK